MSNVILLTSPENIGGKLEPIQAKSENVTAHFRSISYE